MKRMWARGWCCGVVVLWCCALQVSSAPQGQTPVRRTWGSACALYPSVFPPITNANPLFTLARGVWVFWGVEEECVECGGGGKEGWRGG